MIAAAVLTLAASSDAPAAGPLHIIGSQAAGCIAGAVRLPDDGVGFQTIHRSRSVFWGAPSTIARIEALGQQVHAAGLGDLYVGDISRPRGGPFAGGHLSHQMGIDVDIGLDVTPKPALTATQQETVTMTNFVRPDRRGVDPMRWTPAQVTLLHLAAGLPDVDRIFVNPAIKQQLCNEVQGDRSWLRLIRPWYGHAEHMHIRFRCPADQHDCVQGAPTPPGDSCDATLQWWFEQLNAPPTPSPPHHPPPLPAACKAVMEAP